MPSSGYTVITFVADELLTSTKMNQMAANDAAFNSGLGFNDGIIATRHFAAGAVDAAALATNAVTGSKIGASAILLGYASMTTNFVTSSTTPVLVTGMSVSVTVPAGGRSILCLAAFATMYNNTSGQFADVSFYRGTVGGTRIGRFLGKGAAATIDAPGSGFALDPAPAAGNYTYNLAFDTISGGTATLGADTTYPGRFIVLLV